MVSVGLLSIQIRGSRINNNSNDLPVRKSAVEKYMTPVIPDRIDSGLIWSSCVPVVLNKDRNLVLSSVL